MALTTLDVRTALVVVDLQQGIVALPTAPHEAGDVLVRSATLADAFRAHGLPVVRVRVTSAPDGADATPGRTQVPGGGTRPADWDRLVDEMPSDLVVTKRNWSAFYGTDLDLQLRRRRITQVVLTGIATSIGVESTARAAYEHGYNVTLAVDAMTDLDADAHRNSVERIFPRLGETGPVEQLIELLDWTRE
ncbi:isochorismatase family protein [Asanoa siamensis]|uniref:Hydrolase n=1 Tax=Asanoa siamensis TaxID=926357 RepID=A0ABQ4CHT3_9ACTN|nr:isochorismatase family protein [Asanoa siamensis]GIF70553.1 hydrolase [Asanoa siamensis]